MALIPVGKGGSDRDYFRVAAAGRPPAVLMRYGRMYEENEVYAAVASFLRGIGVTVPAIYGHDPERRLILMEDLGDEDLYRAPRRPVGHPPRPLREDPCAGRETARISPGSPAYRISA